MGWTYTKDVHKVTRLLEERIGAQAWFVGMYGTLANTMYASWPFVQWISVRWDERTFENS